MSAAEIAQIIRDHRHRPDESDLAGWCRCSCGETVWDHDNHVAEQIASTRGEA